MSNGEIKPPHQDVPALPQGQDTASEPECVIEFSGAPEEFGFHRQSASHEKARCWDRQELFLAVFRECGKVGKAAEAVGLTRWAVGKWNQRDVFGFRDRVNAAHADYCADKMEAIIYERLPNTRGNRGSDVLLMFNA